MAEIGRVENKARREDKSADDGRHAPRGGILAIEEPERDHAPAAPEDRNALQVHGSENAVHEKPRARRRAAGNAKREERRSRHAEDGGRVREAASATRGAHGDAHVRPIDGIRAEFKKGAVGRSNDDV